MTFFDQTGYVLSLPGSGAAGLDAVPIHVLRNGDGRLLDATMIDTKRSVVLGEQRMTDMPHLRMYKALNALALAGTRVSDRLSIGTVETIETAGADALCRFYHSNLAPATINELELLNL